MTTKINNRNDSNPGDLISDLLDITESKTSLDFTWIVDKLKNKKIIIYAAGKIGERVYRFFLHFGISVAFFWDAKAELIRKVGNIKVLKPDFQQIPMEDRDKYIVVVTVFSERVCHMISNKLIEHGFCNTIMDKKFINLLIYVECRANVNEEKFQFNITTCLFCPFARENETRCDIFDDYVKNNFIRDKLSSACKNALIIPMMGVLVSTRCNLRCKGCNHLREFYKPSDNFDIETERIFDDLGRILDAVDLLYTLVIVGGESFLHKDLENIIDRALRLPKIGIIHIITNGTVMPKNERVFELLSNPRVVVAVTDYGDNIHEKLQVNIKLFLAKMDKFNVNYRYTKQMEWFDFGNFEERGYSREELSRVFSSCCFVTNDLFNGKLHKCSRSVFGTYLGKIPNSHSDYVNVRNTSREDLRNKLIDYFDKKHTVMCRYCNGTSTATIEAGKQIMTRDVLSSSNN
ncbi:MAG TPA: radical SAM protein [Victivallales bacterium]|nr:radical SAM protein [Victivallales bacterium]